MINNPLKTVINYFEVTKRESNGWNEYTYTLSKDLFASDGNYSIAIESVDEDGNVTKSVEESKQAKINFRVDKKAPHIATNDLNEKQYEEYVTENKKVTIVFRDNLDRTLSEFSDYKIYLNDAAKKELHELCQYTYGYAFPDPEAEDAVPELEGLEEL